MLAADIADELAPVFLSALKKSKEGEGAVFLATLANDQKHLAEDVAGLKKVVFEQHEPVVIWSRNFMEQYRKVVGVVVASGLITLIGLLIQVYYLLQKAK